MDLLVYGLIIVLFLAAVWMIWRTKHPKDGPKQKFLIIKHLGQEVRAKVLTEDDVWFKVVTMDDHDDGAVEVRLKKTDRRIVRVYMG
ncbi:MAG: hypothetical protein NTU97_02750 [Candidatus Magasanikbacteria bacterium]|nr:hypothetical protein [Candidatus Magasanikbacteria bacterium]